MSNDRQKVFPHPFHCDSAADAVEHRMINISQSRLQTHHLQLEDPLLLEVPFPLPVVVPLEDPVEFVLTASL